jgi:DNA-directed RNA polymerase subunit F
MTRVPVLLIAEARLAVEHLRRAEDYAANVDEEIVGEMVKIHERLLSKIDSLRNLSQIMYSG